MPIGKGILKIDDYRRFGELVDKMEEFGAYEVAYYPHKSKVYAWFRGTDALKAEQWLKKKGYSWERKPGMNENFVVLAIEL